MKNTINLLMKGLASRINYSINPFWKYSFREVDELVNNFSSFHRLVVRKSEKGGQEDIRKLVENSIFEEAWMYLPKESLWVDIVGGRVKKSFGIYTLIYDMEYVDKLFKEHDELVCYHFHPIKAVSLQMDMIRSKGTDLGDVFTTEELEKYIPIYTAMPSGMDISACIGLSKSFYKLKPNGSITSKISSQHGITELCLTDDGKDYFKDKEILDIVRLGIRIGKHIPIKSVLVEKDETDNHTKIQKLCELVSNEYIKITFTPYKDEKS